MKRRGLWLSAACLSIGVGVLGIAWNLRPQPRELSETEKVAHGGVVQDYFKNRTWTYTFIATDESGIPQVVADGQLIWKDGTCRHGGRVVAGGVGVNPESSNSEIRSYLDEAEYSGIGRVSTRGGEEWVDLPNGTSGSVGYLTWLEPNLGSGACTQIPAVVANITELGEMRPKGEVEREVAARDAQLGWRRWVGEWVVSDKTTRPEVTYGEGYVGITVRNLKDGEPSITMARMLLSEKISSETVAEGGVGSGEVERELETGS
jgi:hypothetical protein